jgi:putative ABC transport system permease protein
MTNAENADAFIEEINAKYPSLEEDGLSLSIDDSAYEQMVGPITSVGSFATTILVVVIIASIIIVALIVTLNVRERRYEMGVLLSLGATKFNVIGQILAELLIVGTVFFALSIPTSTALAQLMGDSLLDSQVSMSKEEQQDNFGRGNNAGRPDMGGGMMMGGSGAPGMPSSTNSDVETITEIDVKASPENYLILFAVGYGVLLLALVLPSVNILRYQPKQILSGKE